MFLAICAPLTALAISVFALGGVASAHVVTSIGADCYQATVHFSDFPERGVMVHIAVDVSGSPTITSDVLVTDTTEEAHVDISAATAIWAGATGTVDVDVTWTYLGPQHIHQSLTLTCGSPTTTTTTTQPTTTTTAGTTTTTAASTTTTSQAVGPQGSTLPPTTTTTVPAGQVLPRTGSDPGYPIVFGLSCVVAGVLLVLRGRRIWSN